MKIGARKLTIDKCKRREICGIFFFPLICGVSSVLFCREIYNHIFRQNNIVSSTKQTKKKEKKEKKNNWDERNTAKTKKA